MPLSSGFNCLASRKMVFFLTATLTVFLACSVSFASMLLDRVVAVVNKEVITWGELYRAMNFEISSGIKSLSDAERNKLFKENEGNFLENMIDVKLQLQEARRLDISAANEEIADAIENIKKKYSMSENDFVESLKKENYSMAEYRKRLSEQIILGKAVSQQVRNKVVISDREINDYMAKNKDIGYRLRLIFFKNPEKGITRDTVQARADSVIKRLKAGDGFAMLARQHSEDPSAREGGDLGYIKKVLLSKEFLEVLSNMNVGDISRPFWTDRGLHIIRLEERPDTANTDEFREFAKKKLFDIQFNEEYKNWIRGLRGNAYIEVRL